MIKPSLEFPDVTLRWDVDEIQNSLDVAIEVLLVGQKALTRAAEPAPPSFVGHQFIEKTRDTILAHVTQPLDKAFSFTRCHRLKYSYRERPEKSAALCQFASTHEGSAAKVNSPRLKPSS